MESFYENYNVQTHKFRDIKLNHYANATDNYKDDRNVQSFISDQIHSEALWKCRHRLLSLYKCFDISKWVTDSQELAMFGLQELRKLLIAYLNLYVSNEEIQEIVGQRADCKVKWRIYQMSFHFTFYKNR